MKVRTSGTNDYNLSALFHGNSDRLARGVKRFVFRKGTAAWNIINHSQVHADIFILSKLESIDDWVTSAQIWQGAYNTVNISGLLLLKSKGEFAMLSILTRQFVSSAFLTDLTWLPLPILQIFYVNCTGELLFFLPGARNLSLRLDCQIVLSVLLLN